METLKCLLLCLSVMLSPTDYTQSKGWRGIIPLHSTRVDVERLLGAASNDCKCAYYLEDVNVFVVYAKGDCKSGGTAGWDILPDTVIRFDATLKKEKDLSKLGINLSAYRQMEDPEIKNVLYYINDAEGIVLAVGKATNEVVGIHYGATVKDESDERLRCPKQ